MIPACRRSVSRGYDYFERVLERRYCEGGTQGIVAPVLVTMVFVLIANLGDCFSSILRLEVGQEPLRDDMAGSIAPSLIEKADFYHAGSEEDKQYRYERVDNREQNAWYVVHQRTCFRTLCPVA